MTKTAILGVVLILALAAAGCSSQNSGSGPVTASPAASTASPAAALPTGPVPAHGKVQAVDASQGQVEIAHDAIPALQMDAMDMKFSAVPPSILKDVKPGEEVDFSLQQQADDSYAVVAIAPAKETAKKKQ